VGELCAPLVEPVAELGGLVEMEAVEERAGVEADGTLDVAGGNGIAEFV
jgi:hypothetical protein